MQGHASHQLRRENFGHCGSHSSLPKQWPDLHSSGFQPISLPCPSTSKGCSIFSSNCSTDAASLGCQLFRKSSSQFTPGSKTQGTVFLQALSPLTGVAANRNKILFEAALCNVFLNHICHMPCEGKCCKCYVVNYQHIWQKMAYRISF